MADRASFGAGVAVMLALVACAGQTGASSQAWGPALAPPAARLEGTSSMPAPGKTFSVSGTYDGTVHVSESGKSYTGSLVVTLKQAGNDLSGSLVVSYDGKTAHLTLDGTVKIEGKKKAALAFKVYDPKGQYGSATATVKGKKLTGKGTAGDASISFTAKRAKK
ncbi:MAG TPA: hypothetical protein VFF63_08170 [Candidatus Babeliales bacterium]|nr:hypothetical protein [Candidatus Babeliales bacterium]